MNAHGRAGIRVDGRAPLWLGGLAAFGIVAAHCFAYILVAPDSHARSLLMDATGHRFWGAVFAVALGAAVAGLAGFVVRGRHRFVAGETKVDLFTYAAPRLISLQLAGFALLEFSERSLTHKDLSGVLTEPAVLLGVVLQVVVALAAALLLTLLARTLRALLDEAPATESHTRNLLRPASQTFRPSLSPGTGAGTWRGPPGRF